MLDLVHPAANDTRVRIRELVPGDMMVDRRIPYIPYNEILTEVVIPPPKPGVRASFEKLRPGGVWDFAMASGSGQHD